MDLLSSRPFWPIRDGLPAAFPPLEADTSCEIAIIGGGVSGALLAWRLVNAGFDVVVLDRREVAHGSTAGNTGLLLYELDVPLWRLARRYGAAKAGRAYRRCRAAVAGLERLIAELRIDCGFAKRASLQLAARAAHVPGLRREFEARRQAGIPVHWWSRSQVARHSSLPHPAGLLSQPAAQVDAYRLTYGLLGAAQRAGAQVHDRTAVTGHRIRAGHVELRTSRGVWVKARELIVAAGFEAGVFLPQRVADLRSTFAIATEPVAAFTGWPQGGPTIWDTAVPYLYLRTTEDRRVVIGGYDEPFRDPVARDRLIAAKAAALRRRLKQFFPAVPFEMATAWAGTFGITKDGLPYIGRHPGVPKTWFALGFGGNGVTFSYIAAEMICAALRGKADPDADLFAFDRAAA